VVAGGGSGGGVVAVVVVVVVVEVGGAVEIQAALICGDRSLSSSVSNSVGREEEMPQTERWEE
jgi:hypothetical protein